MDGFLIDLADGSNEVGLVEVFRSASPGQDAHAAARGRPRYVEMSELQ